MNMKKILLSLFVITSFLSFAFSEPKTINNDTTNTNDTIVLNDTIHFKNDTTEKIMLSSGIVFIIKNGHIYDLSGKLIQ